MRLFFSFFLVIFAMATASLGVWQIQRGFEKKSLYLSYVDRQNLEERQLNRAALADMQYENRRVKVIAKPFGAKRVFVENVTQGGVPGYLVIEFAELVDSTVFAYVRGFKSIGQDRRFVPNVQPLQSEKVEFNGIIRGYSDRVIDIGDIRAESFGDGSYRIQYFERTLLEEISGVALPERVVYKTAPMESDFGYLWAAPKSTESHRSFSYAVQWFLMCFAAVSFLIVMRFRNVERDSDK